MEPERNGRTAVGNVQSVLRVAVHRCAGPVEPDHVYYPKGAKPGRPGSGLLQKLCWTFGVHRQAYEAW